MAALKNEVRLESRQFKSALEELRSLRRGAARAQRAAGAGAGTRARAGGRGAARRPSAGLLLGLLDLRDRLQAGADAADGAAALRRWPRLMPGETRYARSLREGLTLTLQRLDELLATHRVRPIDALGLPLDPQRMHAVGVESAPEAPDGVVLREARRGFSHGGELLRIAEVIVNKKGNALMSEVIVGIDLGTTNSEVAVVRDGRVEVIPVAGDVRILPSVVGIADDGALLVGEAARNQYVLHPRAHGAFDQAAHGGKHARSAGRQGFHAAGNLRDDPAPSEEPRAKRTWATA